VRTLLPVIIGVLAAAVVGGLLDGVVWPGDPLALFRPQLTLLLLALSLLALATGSRRVALGGLATAALGAALLVPAVRDPEPESPGERPTVKVLALNLWHRNDDADAVANLIRRERPDVVALLELTPAWRRALAASLRPYATRAAEPASGSTGVGLYGRAHLREPEVVRLTDEGRPAVEARLDLAGRTASLLVVHPPGTLLPDDARRHERELAAIGAWAREQGPGSVVCGDFNATPWMRSLRDVLSDGDLLAALPGGLFAGSWPALIPPLRVAVDGCLVGSGVRARAELGPRAGSDHFPVLVELA
jgi:endonuclease/exonuclease/phosphatase (EEP) superfamily protein YafD